MACDIVPLAHDASGRARTSSSGPASAGPNLRRTVPRKRTVIPISVIDFVIESPVWIGAPNGNPFERLPVDCEKLCSWVEIPYRIVFKGDPEAVGGNSFDEMSRTRGGVGEIDGSEQS